jgi:hypothetical protein
LLDAWFFPLTVGQPLPTIPLRLAPTSGLNFRSIRYQEVCRLLRIA